MKLICCPLNGPRNASEFICAGPVRRPPPPEASDAEWAEHLFLEDNVAGVVVEWWCHLPTSYWFILERDTRSDEVLAAHRPEDRPDLLA